MSYFYLKMHPEVETSSYDLLFLIITCTHVLKYLKPRLKWVQGHVLSVGD